MTDKFETALKFTLLAEGGYTIDRGGPTNYGVTQAVYNEYNQQHNLPIRPVRKITLDEAKQIYYRNYWLAAGCEDLPLRMAVAMFDFAVNSGVSRAQRYLRPGDTWETYVDRRKEFLKGIGDNRYIRGWMNRIRNLKDFLRKLQD